MNYYKDLLTIGIPAYNEGKYLRETLKSCLDQAGCVIVSDNASTDDTQKICEEFAQKYPNLKYIRQEKNIGGTLNFNFVLEQARTKYFMWMGGHDLISDDYAKHMLFVLENYDVSGCFSAYRPIDKNGEEIAIFDCWFSHKLSSDLRSERVYCVISHLHDAVMLFGIYHTEKMKKYPLKPIIGNDHVFACNMAFEGRIIYLPRSVYSSRQTKIGFSDEENIAAWRISLGNADNNVENSRSLMKQEQLEIFKRSGFKGYGIFRKIYLNWKVKRKLIRRFGKN